MDENQETEPIMNRPMTMLEFFEKIKHSFDDGIVLITPTKQARFLLEAPDAKVYSMLKAYIDNNPEETFADMLETCNALIFWCTFWLAQAKVDMVLEEEQNAKAE